MTIRACELTLKIFMFHTLNGTLPHTFLNFILKVDIPILPSPGINNVFVINDQGNSNKKKKIT